MGRTFDRYDGFLLTASVSLGVYLAMAVDNTEKFSVKG